ncbi:MAG: ATP-binding protein [Planctomycetota bacterium]|jgi:hypothetical protein
MTVKDTVERIREFFRANPLELGPGQPPPLLTAQQQESVAVLANDLLQASRAVNDQAGECHELLRRGQKTEAAAIAKAQPDLRVEADALNFSELGQWLDLCECCSLPAPYVLDQDVVDAVIDDVYGLSHTRNELLRLHRRMAMGRAPLAHRLRVLRKLRQVDSDSNVWKDDIEAYEAARIDELTDDLHRADARGDLPAMTAIRAEMASDKWLHAPSEKVLAAIDQRMAPHRRKLAMERYRKLIDQLRDAHAAMDETLCRDLMARWADVQAKTGFDAGDLAEEIAPVRGWLADLQQAQDDQRAFQQDCAALEAAIDEQAPSDQLDKLAAGVLRHDQGMPQVLAARFQSRMEELRRGGRRRFALAITGVLVAAILLAAGAWLTARHLTRRGDVGRWRSQLADVLADEDLDAAAEMFAQLQRQQPAVYAAPEIVGLRKRYDDLVAQDVSRRQQFANLIAAVETAGLDEPDMASLAAAGKIAQSPTEKAQVEQWRQDIRQYADDARGEHQKAIRPKLKELERLASRITQASASNADAFEASAKRCLDLAREIAAMPGLQPHQAKRIEAIQQSARSAIETARTSTRRQRDIEQALARLPDQALSAGDFAGVLKAFAQKYPSHPLAPDFSRAAEAEPHWQAVARWREILAGWKSGARVTTAAQAAQRKSQVEAYLANHESSPCSDIANLHLQYLTTAAGALPGEKLKYIDSLRNHLNTNIMSGLMLLTTQDGKKYYYLKEMPPEPIPATGTPIRYRIHQFLGADTIQPVHMERLVYEAATRTPAPQVAYAQAAIKDIASFDGTGWETLYLSLAAKAAARDDIDAILRGQLLSRLLGYAEEVVPFVETDLTRALTSLENLDLTETNWLDPDDRKAYSKRPQARELLRQIDLKTMQTTVRDRLARLQASYTNGLQPVGVVLGNKGMKFGTLEPSGRLLVLRVQPTGPPKFMHVGDMAGGKVTIKIGWSDTVPQGTLVFVGP